VLHHLKIPDTFADWVLSHRARLLLLYGVLTIAAVGMTVRTPLRVSLVQGLMPDEAEYEAQVNRAAEFGGGSDDLVYVATREGDALFTADVLNRIRAAARQLEELPEVDRVFTLVDARRLAPDESLSAKQVAARAALRGKLRRGQVPEFDPRRYSSGAYWPSTPARQAAVDMEELRATIQRDPVAGRLLSRGGDAQTMLVRLADSSRLLNQTQSGIREKIEGVLQSQGLGRQGIYCAGTLVIQDWMYDEALHAILLVLPVVAGLVCVMVFVIFHRLSYVLLTLLIAAVAIAWTLGVTAAVFGRLTLLVAAAPGLVLIISTADTIHLISAYTAELRGGLGRRSAVTKVVQEVGGACLLTSLTTFVGFLSLAVVPAVSVRHLAVACAVGVASALVLALTLVPMALMLLPVPASASGTPSRMNRRLDRLVGLCRHWVLTRPRTVVIAHGLILIGLIAAATTMHVDADLPARFAPGHPLRQSIDFFHREVTGTTSIELTIRTSPDRMLAPATLAGLARLERRLASHSQVESVSSLATVFRIVDGLLGAESPQGLPQSQAAAEATVAFLRRIDPTAVESLLAQEAGLSRVAVQVTSTRALEVAALAEELEAIADECLPETQVTSAGFYVVVGKAARQILASQAQGFALCFVCVMVVITLGVRSVRLGLIAMPPNILPLSLLGGVLALTWDLVDSDILGIAIISFGLAVDDTIHFLHRYDIEYERLGDPRDALDRTYRYTGAAIIRTTVILGIGLLPFGLSSYLTIRLLGTYLVFVLASAVLADLLLLPALVLLFGEERDGTSDRE